MAVQIDQPSRESLPTEPVEQTNASLLAHGCVLDLRQDAKTNVPNTNMTALHDADKDTVRDSDLQNPRPETVICLEEELLDDTEDFRATHNSCEAPLLREMNNSDGEYEPLGNDIFPPPTISQPSPLDSQDAEKNKLMPVPGVLIPVKDETASVHVLPTKCWRSNKLLALVAIGTLCALSIIGTIGLLVLIFSKANETPVSKGYTLGVTTMSTQPTPVLHKPGAGVVFPETSPDETSISTFDDGLTKPTQDKATDTITITSLAILVGTFQVMFVFAIVILVCMLVRKSKGKKKGDRGMLEDLLRNLTLDVRDSSTVMETDKTGLNIGPSVLEEGQERSEILLQRLQPPEVMADRLETGHVQSVHEQPPCRKLPLPPNVKHDKAQTAKEQKTDVGNSHIVAKCKIVNEVTQTKSANQCVSIGLGKSKNEHQVSAYAHSKPGLNSTHHGQLTEPSDGYESLNELRKTRNANVKRGQSDATLPRKGKKKIKRKYRRGNDKRRVVVPGRAVKVSLPGKEIQKRKETSSSSDESNTYDRISASSEDDLCARRQLKLKLQSRYVRNDYLPVLIASKQSENPQSVSESDSSEDRPWKTGITIVSSSGVETLSSSENLLSNPNSNSSSPGMTREHLLIQENFQTQPRPRENIQEFTYPIDQYSHTAVDDAKSLQHTEHEALTSTGCIFLSEEQQSKLILLSPLRQKHISITPELNPDVEESLGPIWSFKPHGMQFDCPVLFTFSIPQEHMKKLEHLSDLAPQLKLFYAADDQSEWVDLSQDTPDIQNGQDHVEWAIDKDGVVYMFMHHFSKYKLCLAPGQENEVLTNVVLKYDFQEAQRMCLGAIITLQCAGDVKGPDEMWTNSMNAVVGLKRSAGADKNINFVFKLPDATEGSIKFPRQILDVVCKSGPQHSKKVFHFKQGPTNSEPRPVLVQCQDYDETDALFEFDAPSPRFRGNDSAYSSDDYASFSVYEAVNPVRKNVSNLAQVHEQSLAQTCIPHRHTKHIPQPHDIPRLPIFEGRENNADTQAYVLPSGQPVRKAGYSQEWAEEDEAVGSDADTGIYQQIGEYEETGLQNVSAREYVDRRRASVQPREHIANTTEARFEPPISNTNIMISSQNYTNYELNYHSVVPTSNSGGAFMPCCSHNGELQILPRNRTNAIASVNGFASYAQITAPMALSQELKVATTITQPGVLRHLFEAVGFPECRSRNFSCTFEKLLQFLYFKCNMNLWQHFLTTALHLGVAQEPVKKFAKWLGTAYILSDEFFTTLAEKADRPEFLAVKLNLPSHTVKSLKLKYQNELAVVNLDILRQWRQRNLSFNYQTVEDLFRLCGELRQAFHDIGRKDLSTLVKPYEFTLDSDIYQAIENVQPHRS